MLLKHIFFKKKLIRCEISDMKRVRVSSHVTQTQSNACKMLQYYIYETYD